MKNNFFHTSDRQREFSSFGLNDSADQNEHKKSASSFLQMSVLNQQKNKPQQNKMPSKTVEPSISYSGDTHKQMQSPSDMVSTHSNNSQVKYQTKDGPQVMVGSFKDYTQKNKPAQVVVNYAGCKMKMPFSNEVTAKSAPVAAGKKPAKLNVVRNPSLNQQQLNQ